MSAWKWIALNAMGWLTVVGAASVGCMALGRALPLPLVLGPAVVAATTCAMNWRRMTRRPDATGAVQGR